MQFAKGVRVTLFFCLCISNGLFAQSSGIEIQSGVVVDKEAARVFLMLPGGGTESVQIASGTSNWISSEIDRPLALDNGRLVGHIDSRQSGQLALAYINAGSGDLVSEFDLDLPTEVVTRIDDGLSTQFRIRALAGAGLQNLRWDFQRKVAQGMPGNPEQQKLSGLIDVDVRSLTAAPSIQPAQPLQVQVDIERLMIPGLFGRQFASQSGNFVLESNLLPIGTDPVRKYHWKIYSRDGTSIGETTIQMSYSPFVVVGDHLLLITPSRLTVQGGVDDEEPVSIRVIDLRTGELAWKRAIRDTVYIGPFPV